ncbi:carbon monoxide dehydrogenase small chain (plasmid) [Geobacillus kaustophilus HTA426]|uniref:Carbon monoxide dehydrogenase small chain n=1 Tax=Geobacillus kaustophilus (strain HTA426) TaxID=235909 RepID=Q5QL49_GEOKA|nr:(2Fe-2S)-binding protein [Geobacillus kaustophilus]BAD74261.1 carbon monoxide dehydrogenase small chain [Geobacillus kaustophilus HTA426]
MIKIEKGQKVLVKLKVNGKLYEEYTESRKLLSDFIREDLGLTGTHVGCEHGVCGACTVLVNGRAVRSCLMLAIQADGTEVNTIEGLASEEGWHPLQEEFSKCHALQCGFCTPGILMSAVEFLETNRNPTEEEIKEMLSGHICRCTGYHGIVKAIRQAADRIKNTVNKVN